MGMGRKSGLIPAAEIKEVVLMENFPITGVILLGGESQRLGSPKAFLTHQGKSLAALLAEKMGPHMDQVFFVGKTENQVPEDAKGLGVFATDEPGFPGPLAGLAGALVNTKTPWIFLTGVDMLFFQKKTLAEMWKIRDGGDAVVPHISGYWQPLCALWNQRVLERLKGSPWKSFQYFIDQGGFLTIRVEEEFLRSCDADLSCLQGFNTPEEWAEVQKRLS
jgi:molybdopterin-guanine dinucleotide biosynthesis protein A